MSPEEIQAILELQELDLKLLEYEKHKETLPAQTDVIQGPVVTARAEMVRLESQLKEAETQHRHYEQELANNNVRFRKLQTQQMAVRNQIEYEALTHEMDDLKERADVLEESGLRWIERAEEAKSLLPDAKKLVEERETEAAGLQKVLDVKTTELERVHDEASKLRAPIVQRIAPNVLSYYQRLRRSGKVPFVAVVNRGACAGCGFRHPPQRLQEIKQSRKMLACEQCGRIQVWRGDDDESTGF